MPARHGARGGTRRDASPGVSLRAPKVKGGRWPPFHTFPPITRAANGVRCHQSFARSAKRRPHQVAYRPGAPASSPGGGLRPASRGSAKPAPTTLRPANLTAANGVSPICVESRGRLVERRPPVGTRGSAKPAPMTVRRTDVSGAPPAQSGLRCSLRFAQRCRPPPGGLARGRRSLASASWCPWGYPPRCVARRLAPRPEGERGESPLSHIPPNMQGLATEVSPRSGGRCRSEGPHRENCPALLPARRCVRPRGTSALRLVQRARKPVCTASGSACIPRIAKEMTR